MDLKVNGEATLLFSFFVSHLIRGQLLEKRICSLRSKFFPLRVDTILKEVHCPGKETGSHKNCLPLKNGRLFMVVCPYTLKSPYI